MRFPRKPTVSLAVPAAVSYPRLSDRLLFKPGEKPGFLDIHDSRRHHRYRMGVLLFLFASRLDGKTDPYTIPGWSGMPLPPEHVCRNLQTLTEGGFLAASAPQPNRCLAGLWSRLCRYLFPEPELEEGWFPLSEFLAWTELHTISPEQWQQILQDVLSEQ